MAVINADGSVHDQRLSLALAEGMRLGGYVSSTFMVMLATFGDPDVKPRQPGNRASWLVRTPAGVAVVYDGEGTHDPVKQPEAVIRWHVDGRDGEVLRWVQAAVRSAERAGGCAQLPVPQRISGWSVLAALPVPDVRNEWYVLVDRGDEHEDRGRYGTMHVDAIAGDGVEAETYIGRRGHYDLTTVEQATTDLLTRAGALPAPVTEWWTLWIQSDADCPLGDECGCNTTTLHRSEQAARDALLDYVDARWATNVKDEEPPEDGETRIDDYFETFCTDEQYRINRARVA